MVTWHAILSNGQEKSGTNEDGSWLRLKADIDRYDDKIISVKLTGNGEISTDKNRDGYFLGNKVIRQIAANSKELHLVGLGYYSRSEDAVRIIWCKADTMETLETEVRSREKAGSFLIEN
jgi:hypothetical protein